MTLISVFPPDTRVAVIVLEPYVEEDELRMILFWFFIFIALLCFIAFMYILCILLITALSDFQREGWDMN